MDEHRTCPFCKRELHAKDSVCPYCFATVPERHAGASVADLEARVRQLLASGEKIAAVKEYREATGAELIEAKQAVEGIEAGMHLDPRATRMKTPLENWKSEVVELMRAGNKIQAIRVYREVHGCGLKDAKEAVEEIAAQHGITPFQQGCVVVIGIIAAAVLFGVLTLTLPM